MSWVDVEERSNNVVFQAEVLSTFGQRLQGLLGTDNTAHPVVLVPCRSIHTVGMRYPIDVAFLSAAGKVLAVYRNVEPGRHLHEHQAIAVAERPASSDSWFEVGSIVSYTARSRRRRPHPKPTTNS